MTAMPARRLAGREVGAIGLGCMTMSWGYLGDGTDEEAVRVIRRAWDLGVTHFDTADCYGPFRNEELVGEGLADIPDAFVATKVGLVVGPSGGYPLLKDARPERIREEVVGSLRRLRRDVLDLYYLHRPDPQVPFEDSYGALADLVRDGLVRALGLSEVGVEHLERAWAIHPFAALQSEFSLWTRAPLDDVIPWCASHGVAFVPYSPLGRGYLTGAITDASFDPKDFRATNPRFSAEAIDANRAIVDRVRAVADRHGATPAQVAIAWTMAKGDHVLPIPGTRRLRWLEENVGAASVALTTADVAELDALPEAAGSRY